MGDNKWDVDKWFRKKNSTKPVDVELSSNRHMYFVFDNYILFFLIYEHIYIAYLADIFPFLYYCQ